MTDNDTIKLYKELINLNKEINSIHDKTKIRYDELLKRTNNVYNGIDKLFKELEHGYMGNMLHKRGVRAGLSLCISLLSGQDVNEIIKTKSLLIHG